MGDTIERQQMSERALDERFEVVDETTDGTDPRWKVWDRAEHCYLPGYWSSARDARCGARELAAQMTEER